MAIAPTKLGRLVKREWRSEAAFVRSLRDAGLVLPGVADDALIAALKNAQAEHAALSEDEQAFNSPEERVRVFLEPHLSRKGREWACPGKSLDLLDEWPARVDADY